MRLSFVIGVFSLTALVCCKKDNCTTCPEPQDTTSHNWTFETFLLGGAASSVLYDVAIVNDSTAMGVGELYLQDSSGQADPNACNLVKWDGQNW
jgi:hypothetical protein